MAKEQINLLTRDENEFWLEIKKERAGDISYWKFNNEAKLVRYYEDYYDLKIEWK